MTPEPHSKERSTLHHPHNPLAKKERTVLQMSKNVLLKVIHARAQRLTDSDILIKYSCVLLLLLLLHYFCRAALTRIPPRVEK